jgi:hypothetical protein
MRWMLVTALAVLQSPLPPAYPREGASKLLENDRVIVWNIAWLKQAYPLHRHPYALSGVYYTSGDRIIVSTEGARRPVSTKAGDTAFQRAGVTHIEEGASDSPLRAVFFELKEDAPGPPPAGAAPADAFSSIAGTPLLDNERVRAWVWPALPQARRHRHLFDAVVIAVNGTTPRVAFVARGTVHDAEEIGTPERGWIFEIK